jgi:hypothetical protein
MSISTVVLEAVYEQNFLPCSHGFRPGRSAHQALQSLHTAIMSQAGIPSVPTRRKHGRDLSRRPHCVRKARSLSETL